MDKKKVMIPQLKEFKQQGKKLRVITAYDYSAAVVVDKTPIEMILVGDSLGMVVLGYDSTVSVTMEDMLHHVKPVVRGASNTMVIADMPFGSYQVSREEAIRNATRFMKEAGADCVKLEGGLTVLKTVRAIVDAGIPVMGHIGLTPQTVSQLGGFKVQGRDVETAKRLIDEAQQLEEAGAFSIVIECVPAAVAKLITEQISIPTIGIGAGADCDGQVLVWHDLLGMFDRFVPKFVKQYANLNTFIIEALMKYAEEVEQGAFPAEKHCFGIQDGVLKTLY